MATALLKPKLGRNDHGWGPCLKSPDTLDLLAERDLRRYRLQRRLIGPIYNTSNVKQYEGAVDSVLDRVIPQLRSLNGAEVDLKEWMHIIVVECLGAVTLSWSPGYLCAKSDGNSGKHAYMGWRRKSVFGVFPWAVISESFSKSAGRAFANFWGLTYHTPKEGFNPFFPVSALDLRNGGRTDSLAGCPKEDHQACQSWTARAATEECAEGHHDRPHPAEQRSTRV